MATTGVRMRAAAIAAGRPIVLVLCFGLIGLVALLPGVRRRREHRADACGVCRRRYRVRGVVLTVFAVVLLAGAATRGVAAARPPVLCGSHISGDGTVTPEPLLDLATSGSQTWHAVRGALVAPVSGLALLTTSAIGMAQCSGPPLLVGFWPAERADSGSIVGDLFVTRQLASDGPAGFFQEGGRSTGVPFIRYGPNLPISRAAEERLGLHEERHVDQWAVATVAAGPAAFPVAYFADYLVFPYARSHFERAASLDDGDYPIPPDFGPAPLWGPILGVALVAALLLRSRLVLAFRLARGREVVVQPDRCRLHTSGAWRRASARAALRAR